MREPPLKYLKGVHDQFQGYTNKKGRILLLKSILLSNHTTLSNTGLNQSCFDISCCLVFYCFVLCVTLTRLALEAALTKFVELEQKKICRNYFAKKMMFYSLKRQILISTLHQCTDSRQCDLDTKHDRCWNSLVGEWFSIQMTFKYQTRSLDFQWSYNKSRQFSII